MSKLNSFGFCNVKFKGNGGNYIHLNDLVVSPNGKAAIVYGKNQTGKTSMLTILASFFNPIGHKRSINGKRLEYYFRSNQEIPGLVFIDLIGEIESDHTLIAQWFTYTGDPTRPNLSMNSDDLLNRYAVVINYNAKENIAPTSGNIELLKKLGLIKYDDSLKYYVPLKQENIKQALLNNAKNLNDFNLQAALVFCNRLNSSTYSNYKQQYEQRAVAHMNFTVWRSLLMPILKMEGGINANFVDKNGRTKSSGQLISGLILPQINTHNNNQEALNKFYQTTAGALVYKHNNEDSIKKCEVYSEIRDQLKQLNTDKYINSLNKILIDHNRIVQTRANLISEKLTKEETIVELQQKLSQLKKSLEVAEYQKLLARVSECQKECESNNSAALDKKDKVEKMWNHLIRSCAIHLQAIVNRNNKVIAAQQSNIQNYEREAKDNTEDRNNEQLIAAYRFYLKTYYNQKIDHFKKYESKITEEIQKTKNKVENLRSHEENSRSTLEKIHDTVSKLDSEITAFSQKKIELLRQYNVADLNEIKVKQVNAKNKIEYILQGARQTKEQLKYDIDLNEKSQSETQERQLQLREQEINARNNVKQLQDQRTKIEEFIQFLRLNDGIDQQTFLGVIQNKTSDADSIRDQATMNIANLNNQLQMLETGQIPLPEVIKSFIEKNQINYQTGLQFLESISEERQQKLQKLMPLLPYSILLAKEDYQKINKEFHELSSLIEPIVFYVNEDEIESATFGGNNVSIVNCPNFSKIHDLENLQQDIRKKIGYEQEKKDRYVTLANKYNTILHVVKNDFISREELVNEKAKSSNLSQLSKECKIELKRLQEKYVELEQQFQKNEQKIKTAENDYKNYQESILKLDEYLDKEQIINNRTKPKLKDLQNREVKIKDRLADTSKKINEFQQKIVDYVEQLGKISNQLRNEELNEAEYHDAFCPSFELQNSRLINDDRDADQLKKDILRLENDLSENAALQQVRIQECRNKIDLAESEIKATKEKILVILNEQSLESVEKCLVESKELEFFNDTQSNKEIQSCRNSLSKLNEELEKMQFRVEKSRKEYNDAKEDQELALAKNENLAKVSILKDSVSIIESKIVKFRREYNEQEKRIQNIEVSRQRLYHFCNDNQIKDSELGNLIEDHRVELKDIDEINEIIGVLRRLKKEKSDLITQIIKERDSSFERIATSLKDDAVNFKEKISELKETIKDDLSNFFDSTNIIAGVNSEYLACLNSLLSFIEGKIELKQAARKHYQNDLNAIAMCYYDILVGLKEGLDEIETSSRVNVGHGINSKKALVRFRGIYGKDLTDENVKVQIINILKTRIDQISLTIDYNANNISQQLKKKISLSTLFEWAFGSVDNIKLELLNVNVLNVQSRVSYDMWNGQLQVSKSGGAWIASGMLLIISLMKYLSSNNESLWEDSAFLLVDNLLSTVNDKGTIGPALDFAKEIGIQIVTFTDHPNSELSETFDYSVALASFENQGLASINLQSIRLPDSSDVMVMVNYIDEKTDLNI